MIYLRLKDMEQQKQYFLYDFLIRKKFRVWRHILLALIIATIVIRGVLSSLEENALLVGNKIYLIMLFSFILDLTVIYFNLYILVPRILLKNRYVQYIVALIFIVLIFLLINFGGEYYIFKYENNPFGESSAFYPTNNLIAEIINSFISYITLIVSISMTILFKSWLMNMQRISQLETNGLRTQLESMKEKVSPSFLSRMLKKSASLALSTPQQSSYILLILSKILRYQLYDCNREKVLLGSEIVFLTNYLNLEKIYFENLAFVIDKKGNMSHIFVYPLLFLPIIQNLIEQTQGSSKQFIMEIYFAVENSRLQFVCRSNGIDKINYSSISRRFEILYSNQYLLEMKGGNELSIQFKI